MKRALATLPIGLFLFFGCATTGSGGDTNPDGPFSSDSKDGEDGKSEVEGLERKLNIARQRLELAKLEEASFQSQQETKVRHATAEVDMAQARLARFQEQDKENKLASAQLDLRTAKDRAQEAADELAQIEIMYEDQDLDDLTAEFVVSRGRRSAERAAKRIEIQEGQLASLGMELEQEEKSLVLAVDKAKSGLDQLQTEGETGAKSKAISVQEAENEVARLEKELEAARKKEQP